MRRRLNSSRGQTLVEFALITPIIVLLLAGIVDFGLAMDHRLVLQHAAREGARMAAVSDDYTGTNGICNYTFSQAQGALASKQKITFFYDELNGTPGHNAGDNVKITLTAEWDLPIVGQLIGDHTINLTATASARLERTVTGVTVCPP